MQHFPPNSWQPVSLPNPSLSQHQLKDSVFFSEIPSSFPSVQPPFPNHQYSTGLTAQEPQAPSSFQLPYEPSRPSVIAHFLSTLGAPVQYQGKMVQAQSQIQLVEQDAAMINYLLQQGFTVVPQPQPVVSKPPQSTVAQPQLPSWSVSQQATQHLEQRPPQPTVQPQLPASSFLQQHLQLYPLQQLEPVVPKPPQPIQPQHLPSSALYAQLQQQHQQHIVTQLPLLSSESLHSMSLDDLKKQELLLQDLIRRSMTAQQPNAPIKNATKPANSDPFPFSVHPSPLQKRAPKPTAMSKNPSVRDLPALQKLAALQTTQIVSTEKLRPVAPVAPSQRIHEAPFSLVTESKLLVPSIPSAFLQESTKSSTFPVYLPSSLNAPTESFTSQPSPPQSQKVPFANPVSLSELPPWHSLSIEAKRNVFLNQNVILEAARQKEEKTMNMQRKAACEERSRPEQDNQEHATWRSWMKDGVPPPTAQKKLKEAKEERKPRRSYYAKRKAEMAFGPVIVRTPLSIEKKREKQRAHNRAWRDRNYVKVIGEVRPAADKRSKDQSVTRLPCQLNIKAEPIDDESEPIQHQVRLEVRRELPDLADNPTEIAEQAETLMIEETHQPSRKTPVQKAILDATPLLASLLSSQSCPTAQPQSSSLSPPPSLSYEVSREATRSPTQDSHTSILIRPPSLLLQDAQREPSETAQYSNEILPPLEDKVGSKNKISPIKCDRLNKAVRSYYERKKIAQGLGPVRRKVILTEDEKRAKRTAASRAWRLKNYVKFIGEFPPAEPIERERKDVSSRTPMLRNIKQEPLDETEEQNQSAYQSLIDWGYQAVEHATGANAHPTADADPWSSPASSDYSVEL